MKRQEPPNYMSGEKIKSSDYIYIGKETLLSFTRKYTQLIHNDAHGFIPTEDHLSC